MAGKRVGLVSCSKAKLATPAPARQMYSPSDLFRKASAYCALHCDEWYILSAKYGLVDPEKTLEPYDVTLKKMNADQKRHWGRTVADQIRAIGPAELEIHAGKDYAQPLVDAGPSLQNPLAGLSLGFRKKWYLDHMETNK